MTRLKITLLAGVVAMSLFGFGTSKSDILESRVQTVETEQSFSIRSQKLSSNALLIAPFKSEDIFLSEVLESDFVFTSVGGDWEQFTPDNTAVQVQVRFQVDGKWENWVDVETEDDQDQSDKKDPLKVRKYTFASTNPATAMQYKFVLLGDGINSPHVEKPNWTFVRTGEGEGGVRATVPRYGGSLAGATVRNLTVNSATNGIISRSEWGANENLRYQVKADETNGNGSNGDEAAKDVSVSAYALELKEDSRGMKYTWPLQYPYKVERFVIHHTATSSNLDNPKQAIRDIYYYHAVTRGWGDIGYNYIIDKNGNIYEGRYGGEGVVGGHALGANNGSIGIAILGNYENGEVPEPVVRALGELIGQKSKVHNIDPSGFSVRNGQTLSNIITHRDVAKTTCPGAFLYEKLPVIRSLAGQVRNSNSVQSGNAYDFNNLSGAQYVTLDPGGSTTLNIKLSNIGRREWNSGTRLIVKNTAEIAGKVEITGGVMQEGSVARGGTGSFNLTVKALTSGQVVYPQLVLQTDGMFEVNKVLEIPVVVKNVMPTYSFVEAYYPPATMQHGEVFQGWVKLKNTSNVTWQKSGSNQISLKTAREVGRNSELLRVPSDTFAFLKEREVKPGEIGTFNLNLVAPSKTGTYKEYFVPFISGIGYLNDDGLNFSVNVYNSQNGSRGEAEVLKLYSKAEWTRNRSYSVTVKVMNETSMTWSASNFGLKATPETGIAIRNEKFTPATVKPGEVATLSLVAKPLAEAKAGDGKLLINPILNGKNLYVNPLTINYRVVEQAAPTVVTRPVSTNNGTSTENSPVLTPTTGNLGVDPGNFRVKLSFVGDPEISANGGFKLYNGQTFVANLKAGDVVKVSMRGAEYKVETAGTVRLMAGPVRLVPDNGIVMKINNHENRPVWNTSLNDNVFLGTLEVNSDNFKPIVINELPLEDYLKGLGEVSNGEPTEKIKAVMVAARTYATFYMTKAEKFAGKPYHLDDTPSSSQYYIGYGLTMRSPNVSAAVDATRGEVVTLNGNVVKTAYFSQSDGIATKNARDVWGWTDTPHLVSVDDSYCNGNQFLGHGVGMSGCGAKGMANAGKNYKEILAHYYKGTSVSKLL